MSILCGVSPIGLVLPLGRTLSSTGSIIGSVVWNRLRINSGDGDALLLPLDVDRRYMGGVADATPSGRSQNPSGCWQVWLSRRCTNGDWLRFNGGSVQHIENWELLIFIYVIGEQLYNNYRDYNKSPRSLDMVGQPQRMLLYSRRQSHRLVLHHGVVA